MRLVHVHPDAEADLIAIAGYLAEFSPAAAERFIQYLEGVLADLREFPELGQASVREPDSRVMRREVYRFRYELTEAAVILTRISDGRGEAELP